MTSIDEVEGRRAALEAIEQLTALIAQGLRRAEVSESASNPMTGARSWEDRSTVSPREEITAALHGAADEVERVPGAIRDGGSGDAVLGVWTQTIFQGFVGKFVSPGWLAVNATADALSGGYYLRQALSAYRAGKLDLALTCARNGVDATALG
jgi:hypothetical protein